RYHRPSLSAEETPPFLVEATKATSGPTAEFTGSLKLLKIAPVGKPLPAGSPPRTTGSQEFEKLMLWKMPLALALVTPPTLDLSWPARETNWAVSSAEGMPNFAQRTAGTSALFSAPSRRTFVVAEVGV